MRLLRPLPHRGDQLAAGVVCLVVLDYLVEFRFDEKWGDTAHLVHTSIPAVWITLLALLSPRDSKAPHGYQSVLYVASFLLVAPTLFNLAAVLGGDNGSAGTITWVAFALTALMTYFARARESAVSAFLAAASLATAVLAGIQWGWDPDGLDGFRWALLVLAAGFALGAVAQRDRRPLHGVSLADVAGLLILGLALTFLVESFLGALGSAFTGGDDLGFTVDIAWGWELVVLAAGLGLVAYGAVDRARGPGWIGVANLFAFAALAAGSGSDDPKLMGWPLVLAVAALAFLVLALRPSRPLPPAPDAGAPPAPAAPLRPQ